MPARIAKGANAIILQTVDSAVTSLISHGLRMQEVVLVACSSEANVTAWDLATGVALTQFKGNASTRHGFVQVGSDYLAAAQVLKDAVHFWAWHKEQVVQRSFTPERLTALAASPDGSYLAAGGGSGAVYLWDTPSGRLLATWPAHYKAVSCLAFSDSGTVLVTGGEDTLVAAWSLGSLLDPGAAAPGQQRVTPLHTWSEHTLPVTSLCLGTGDVSAVLVTASLDRSVKFWALATGQLLRSVTLPAGITAAALDPGEHALYVGGLDGSIWEVPLVPTNSSSGPPAAAVAAGAGGSSSSGGLRALVGHTKPISGLQFSRSGEQLVSGCEDGTVRVWDLASGQCLRTISSPSKAPVSAVIVTLLPPYLTGVGAAASTGASARQGPRRPQPLAPLAKFTGVPGGLKPWEGAPVVLDGSSSCVAVAQASGLLGAVPGLFSGAEGAAAGGAGGTSTGAAAVVGAASGGVGAGEQDPLQALQQRVEGLQQQLAESQALAQQWQQLHAQLHDFTTRQVLGAAV